MERRPGLRQAQEVEICWILCSGMDRNPRRSWTFPSEVGQGAEHGARP